VIEPSDQIITCFLCGEIVHGKCRGSFNACDICTEEKAKIEVELIGSDGAVVSKSVLSIPITNDGKNEIIKNYFSA
jgi:hypothetical protein